MLATEPERRHETLDTVAIDRGVEIDEVRAEARVREIDGFAFADTGIAAAFRPTDSARVAPDAIGSAREGLVHQHLAAWCDADRDAQLSTWRTTGGVEVDCVVETAAGLVAVEVKSGHTQRPPHRRGPLAFHHEFPDAPLVALADVPVQQQQGPITIFPVATFLLGIVPGAPRLA
jgi:predicted AAA+ superfamily ATPase